MIPARSKQVTVSRLVFAALVAVLAWCPQSQPSVSAATDDGMRSPLDQHLQKLLDEFDSMPGPSGPADAEEWKKHRFSLLLEISKDYQKAGDPGRAFDYVGLANDFSQQCGYGSQPDLEKLQNLLRQEWAKGGQQSKRYRYIRDKRYPGIMGQSEQPGPAESIHASPTSPSPRAKMLLHHFANMAECTDESLKMAYADFAPAWQSKQTFEQFAKGARSGQWVPGDDSELVKRDLLIDPNHAEVDVDMSRVTNIKGIIRFSLINVQGKWLIAKGVFL